MIHFAYDGSINGNWTAHYALRLAAQHSSRSLRLLHVQEARESEEALADALAHLRLRANRLGVEMALEPLPPPQGGRSSRAKASSVARVLLEQVPRGAEHLLVSGTRLREGARGYLTGTVSERLLRAGQCSVMAVRVVQPGLLGFPHRLLMPLAGSPTSLNAAQPFLRLLAPQLSALVLLRVRELFRWRFRMLNHETGRRLLEPERAFLREMEAWLVQHLGLTRGQLEQLAVLSDDVPKEIVIAANRTKAQLLLMGASRRNLRERFVWGNPIEQVLRNAPCDVAITSSPTP